MEKDLDKIFSRLKEILMEYEKSFEAVVKDGQKENYELWSFKEVVVEGRKRNEVYFAGIVKQKDYVGFYFMPVYVNEEIKNVIPEKLLKLLKGKSCFHIKKLDEELENEIKKALLEGYNLYKSRQWI